MWATSVPILVFLGVSVLDLAPMYETDRQIDVRRQTGVRHESSLNASAIWGWGIIMQTCLVRFVLHYTVSQKTVACFIFYNLKLEMIMLAHCILIVLATRRMDYFQSHFIFTCRTLQFIWTVENDAFSCHCQVSKHAI